MTKFTPVLILLLLTVLGVQAIREGKPAIQKPPHKQGAVTYSQLRRADRPKWDFHRGRRW